ncbi:unnamed protein product [Camellia sinensis]
MSQRRDIYKVFDDEEEEWEKMEEEEEDLIPKARRSIPFDIKPDHFSSLPPLCPPTSTRPAVTTSMETATDKQRKKINEEEEEEEEEEKEKAKQVSKEGNPSSSSSTPLEETSTETEGSGKTTVKPFGKGNVVDLPFKKLTIRDDVDIISESKPGHFSIKFLQLTSRDIRNGVLFVLEQEVRNHFPTVNIPAGTSKIERLTFTDTQNMDWGMKIHFDGVFVITHGWDEFVNEHHLEAMDTIKFYKVVRPLHHTHFRIECVKREGAARTSQTYAKDGKGGCRRYRFGRKKGGGGGGGGGSSHYGGRRGKWNTMCCWTWKNQPRGRERAVMILEEVLQVGVCAVRVGAV